MPRRDQGTGDEAHLRIAADQRIELVTGDEVHRRVGVHVDGAQHVGRELFARRYVANHLHDRLRAIEARVDEEIATDRDRREEHTERDAVVTS